MANYSSRRIAAAKRHVVKPECHGIRGQRGNVALELALVLPLFLLLLGGVIDFGMLFWEKQVLTNATREGARAATLADGQGYRLRSNTFILQSVVQPYLDNFNLKDASGSKIVLVDGTNFICTEDRTQTPFKTTVELKDIPVGLMLLPNVQSLFGASGPESIMLGAKTTMAAEWTK
jgi:Flp pilus assembly protein TadG